MLKISNVYFDMKRKKPIEGSNHKKREKAGTHSIVKFDKMTFVCQCLDVSKDTAEFPKKKKKKWNDSKL